MRFTNINRRVFAIGIAITLAYLPIATAAQTQITLPKNKYKVQDDITLGQKTVVEIERKFPLINDSEASRYLERVGQSLVAGIPEQFQQPAFQYRFKLVNASDINAFALPGGPMYVNRGMIEAAKNEGEMAGVMAHEISHVALRHSTAQATKQTSATSTLGQLGLILGGSILGGQSGAQMGQMAAAAWMTKYSRDFESQADILGARIMTNAGYDPRDLANMFQTIAKQSGGARGPAWLSSHPDPGNRFQKINQEAGYLPVSQSPIKVTRDFQNVQARLRSMPPGPTMAQIEQGRVPVNNQGGGATNGGAMSGGRYTTSVPAPSAQTRAFSAGELFTMSVPSNWNEFPGESSITFAPEGAYGQDGITHGILVGVVQPQAQDLKGATDKLVQGILQNNQYLQNQSGSVQTSISSMRGYANSLVGASPITRRNENVTIYTAPTRDRRLFYMITVAPEAEAYRYNAAFSNLIRSVRLN